MRVICIAIIGEARPEKSGLIQALRSILLQRDRHLPRESATAGVPWNHGQCEVLCCFGLVTERGDVLCKSAHFFIPLHAEDLS